MKRTPLKRKTPLKRTRMERKPERMRTAEEGGDPSYLAFVRTLPCASCHVRGPNHAHHETGAGRGKGQKAPDRRTLPLCWSCHAAFHECTRRFAGWTRDMKKAWQGLMIQDCQASFAAITV